MTTLPAKYISLTLAADSEDAKVQAGREQEEGDDSLVVQTRRPGGLGPAGREIVGALDGITIQPRGDGYVSTSYLALDTLKSRSYRVRTCLC